LGHPPKLNIWSAADWIELPRLVLSRVTFKENKATAHGGAIAFAGSVQGQGLVMTGNEAATAGGAIASWRAAPLPDPYGTVLQALVDNTQPVPSDKIVLARSVLTDNKVGKSGAALSLSDADAIIGNSIIARNNSATGAVVAGTKLRIVNTVVADNAGTGIEASAGATIGVGNTVIARNATNCTLAQPLLILGPNIQHPGSQCGSQIQSTDPGLDGHYAPGLISAARDAGDFGLCVTEPTVAGIDLLGRTRVGGEQKCAIGAIERNLPDTIASALTFGATQHFGPCFVWLLILLLLVAFVVGFMIWRRRRRRTNGSR
jgi:predicted outer membrane repeat protein